MFILTVSFSYAPATLSALCTYGDHITLVFRPEKVAKDLEVAYVCMCTCVCVLFASMCICIRKPDNVETVPQETPTFCSSVKVG